MRVIHIRPEKDGVIVRERRCARALEKLCNATPVLTAEQIAEQRWVPLPFKRA